MISNYFSTPIYDSDISTNLTVELENYSKSLLEKNEFQIPPGWNSHYISEFSLNKKCKNSKLLELIDTELYHHVKDYIRGFDSKVGNNYSSKFEITNSWFTLTKKNNFAHMHMHSDADIAGVIYIETNSEDGDLYFLNPNKVSQYSRTFSNIDSLIFYKPKKSKIILFPGWLEHGISHNLTDSNRISFSFNIIFER
jgi:uncharacterized protein (TIGR02466 family)